MNVSLPDLRGLCVSEVNSSNRITHRRGAEAAENAQRKPDCCDEFCRIAGFKFEANTK